MKCYDLIAEAKKAKKITTDSEIARILGITRQSLNGIKKGGTYGKETLVEDFDQTIKRYIWNGAFTLE